LTSLRTLELADTNITGAGLAHLKGLVELRHLGLKANHVTPHKDFLAVFPNGNCTPRIDDDGLKHLKGLRRLEYLYLDGNNITDAGLAHLAGLSEMQTLTVENTKVTPAALARVRKQQTAAPKLPPPTTPSAVDDFVAETQRPSSAPAIQLPRHFDQLELTNEQLEKMKKIAQPYDAKIAELKQKMQQAARVRVGTTSIIIAARNAINKVSAQRTQALEGVLTDKQREKLRELRG
jgi:hypothetical protein